MREYWPHFLVIYLIVHEQVINQVVMATPLLPFCNLCLVPHKRIWWFRLFVSVVSTTSFWVCFAYWETGLSLVFARVRSSSLRVMNSNVYAFGICESCCNSVDCKGGMFTNYSCPLSSNCCLSTYVFSCASWFDMQVGQTSHCSSRQSSE